MIEKPAGDVRTSYELSLEREIDRLEQAIDQLLTRIEWMTQELEETKDELAAARSYID